MFFFWKFCNWWSYWWNKRNGKNKNKFWHTYQKKKIYLFSHPEIIDPLIFYLYYDGNCKRLSSRHSNSTKGSSVNDVTVLWGDQGFCDGSTKVLVIKSVEMGEGVKNWMTSFLLNPKSFKRSRQITNLFCREFIVTMYLSIWESESISTKKPILATNTTNTLGMLH